ncbi:MAG: Crp/Fnr family transcriptional regulator [Clostridia bacterium]|nr:Crp/Fnr family transcriptional regulator [Clostridia bacterium]
MKKYIPVLKRSQLFSGVSEDEIAAMLSCLDAKVRTYQKGEYIFRQGEHVSFITVLVEGNLYIQRDDFWGSRSIIQHMGVGEMFGEAYMAPESGAILNDVVAAADSTVIFFDVKRIITTCSSACRFHAMVVQNLIFAISEKNRRLVQKLGHMAKRTTREKLLSYLSDEARRQNRAEFTIPFNRQELADFLYVDRSAMSAELGRMRDEGILEFEKNKFRLI